MDLIAEAFDRNILSAFKPGSLKIIIVKPENKYVGVGRLRIISVRESCGITELALSYEDYW